MPEKKAEAVSASHENEDDKSLKYGVIIFAVIEALVLIPFVLYMILH